MGEMSAKRISLQMAGGRGIKHADRTVGRTYASTRVPQARWLRWVHHRAGAPRKSTDRDEQSLARWGSCPARYRAPRRFQCFITGMTRIA
eukprot:1619172-Rhodomonas_salina.2